MEHVEKIKLLRMQIPVGIKQAEKLLTESNHDIIMTEQLFKANMINLFMQKQIIAEEQAKQYLQTAKYDMGIAITLYENDKYNIAELCLRKYKDKEEAIFKLLTSIEQKYNHTLWLCWQKDDMPPLNEVEYTFAVLMEWMGYEDWEGVIIVQKCIVTLLKKLNVTWLVILLEKVLQREEELKGTTEKYWEDEAYKILNSTYLERRADLIEHLYQYVQDHIRSFS